MKCTHRAIRSWSQLDGLPVQLWSCVDCGWRFEPIQERKPLTDEEISALVIEWWCPTTVTAKDRKFIRAIERAHGIGEKE